MLPGFTKGRYSHLIKLVNAAAKAQEEEHNTRNAPDSTPSLTAVEKYAKRFGYTTDWNVGIYPTFNKNGCKFYLD